MGVLCGEAGLVVTRPSLGVGDDCRGWSLPLLEEWGGCGSPSRLGVGGVAKLSPLPCMQPVACPRLCGYVDKVMRWGGVWILGRYRQVPVGAEMGDARMQILLGFRRAGGGCICGCLSPPWRRH